MLLGSGRSPGHHPASPQQGGTVCIGSLAAGTSLQSQTKLQLFWTWAKLMADALCDAVGLSLCGT